MILGNKKMSHWARVVKNIAYIYLLDAYGALCNTWSFASIVQDFLKQENAVVLPHPPYLPDLVQGDIFVPWHKNTFLVERLD